MSFQISSGIDENKIFLVNYSEIEGRLDPFFYRQFFRDIVRNVNKAGSDKLKNLVRFSNEYWDQEGIFGKTFPYIEIGEVDLITAEINKIDELSIEDAPSRAKMVVRKGDILVSTTRPSRGAISFVEDDQIYIASTGFSVIRGVKKSDIDVRYLFCCLRLNSLLLQMEQRSSGGNYPAITQEELGKVRVPIPSPKIQSQAVAKIGCAYAAKRQKEAEAQRLLGSIDDYLLGELGIKLPEQLENTLQDRIFTRQLSEVSGGRFDPNYHFNIYKILDCSSTYDFSKLKDLIKCPPQYGANEVAIDGNKDFDTRYIRITDINEIGELSNSSWKTANRIEKKYLLNYNDLLLARAGSVGVSYLHKDTANDAIFAGYLIRFVIDETMAIPDYIFFCCHSVLYKLWVEAIYRPAVQPNINAEEYKALSIPLPPLEKQEEIVGHIQKIRNQAKQLQQEAEADLDQAKKEVEEIILKN